MPGNILAALLARAQLRISLFSVIDGSGTSVVQQQVSLLSFTSCSGTVCGHELS